MPPVNDRPASAGHPKPGDIMFLAVRTDPDAPIRRGISVLLVDTTSEGFSSTENITLSGQPYTVVGVAAPEYVLAPPTERIWLPLAPPAWRLNDFADHWNYGMKRLVKKVDMTGEAILAAGQRYAAVEGALSAPIQALP